MKRKKANRDLRAGILASQVRSFRREEAASVWKPTAASFLFAFIFPPKMKERTKKFTNESPDVLRRKIVQQICCYFNCNVVYLMSTSFVEKYSIHVQEAFFMSSYNILFPSYTIGTDAYTKIPEICPTYGRKIAVIGGVACELISN